MPACRSPIGCNCRPFGPRMLRGGPRLGSQMRLALPPRRRLAWSRSARHWRTVCRWARSSPTQLTATRQPSVLASPNLVCAMCWACSPRLRSGPPGTAPLPPRPKTRPSRGRPQTRLQRPPDQQPFSLKDLALRLPKRARRTVSWREGSQGALSSRFVARRVRPAHRDSARSEPWPEEWLLIEWPTGEAAPTKYWLSNLPPRTALQSLVRARRAG